MWFVVLGTVLLILKVADLGAVGHWSWWAVLWPFPLAIVWWTISDSMGLTQRREMRKMEEKKVERRLKAMQSLGIKRPSTRRDRATELARQRLADRVEGERTKVREANVKEVRDSVLHSSSFHPDAHEPPEPGKK